MFCQGGWKGLHLLLCVQICDNIGKRIRRGTGLWRVSGAGECWASGYGWRAAGGSRAWRRFGGAGRSGAAASAATPLSRHSLASRPSALPRSDTATAARRRKQAARRRRPAGASRRGVVMRRDVIKNAVSGPSEKNESIPLRSGPGRANMVAFSDGPERRPARRPRVFLPEGWLSGRRQRFAKSSDWVTGPGGSNPPPSANLLRSRDLATRIRHEDGRPL